VSNLLTECNFITNGLSCLLMVVKIFLVAGFFFFVFFLWGWGVGSAGRYAAYANKSSSSAFLSDARELKSEFLHS